VAFASATGQRARQASFNQSLTAREQMIVVRFKVKCQAEKADELRVAFQSVVAPSRRVKGVLHFDIARDIADPSSFIAAEVFSERAALERQEALSEVQKVIALLPNVLAGDPEAAVYNVSSSEPEG
jgi:quinol monooxygenase YgiN